MISVWRVSLTEILSFKLPINKQKEIALRLGVGVTAVGRTKPGASKVTTVLFSCRGQITARILMITP